MKSRAKSRVFLILALLSTVSMPLAEHGAEANGLVASAGVSQNRQRKDSQKDDDPNSIANPPANRMAEQSGSTTQSGSAGRTPPPFDRPPISSGQPPPAPRTQPRQTAPDDSDPAATPERDRTGRARPELGRPGDSTRDPIGNRTPTDGSNKPPDDTGNDTIQLNATLVNIPVLVSDRSGRYIPQLTRRDFEVYEDGAPQEVAFFSNEEVAFNVLLLMDVSPSVANSLEDIQDAGLEFVRQLRPQDRVMVVSFDQRLHVMSDFTNNRGTLESAIRGIRTGGGTSVYDAVYRCVTEKFRSVEGRKALILFSDGDDTTSRHAGYREAIDAVTESDVLVYSLRYPGSDFGVGGGGGGPTINLPLPIPIPFPWPRRRWPTPSGQPRRGGSGNGDFMSDVANAGGGPVYDAETIQDLSRLSRQIAEELRHVYVVSYYPTNALANGGYRSIRVRIKSRSDLAVRHRKGYNAHDVQPTKTTH